MDYLHIKFHVNQSDNRWQNVQKKWYTYCVILERAKGPGAGANKNLQVSGP